MATNSDKLARLHQEIRHCQRCLLWKTAKNAVPGEGPANANVVFVGEAPGRHEDLTGRPFIGRAGKLLTQLLDGIGVKREAVFITSAVKHRPPKNRKPNPKEIGACKTWWQKQAEMINPELIVLLGRTASDSALGKDFWEKRGKVFREAGQDYFITYHPAAGLRSPVKIKSILEKDFKKLKARF
ncbi:MAG: uracil-DNA glycosylase [Candidatus Wildermuthbacteria bacterium]|nr:uracil-DNA glycosylase [Candidatus Wildermuthbacteria bacterium]